MEPEFCPGDCRLDLHSRAGLAQLQVQKSTWAGAWVWPLPQLTLSWAAPDPHPRAPALWSGTPAVPGSGGLARGLGLSAHVKALLSQPGPPSEVLLDDV